jgi:hypothetical protein
MSHVNSDNSTATKPSSSKESSPSKIRVFLPRELWAAVVSYLTYPEFLRVVSVTKEILIDEEEALSSHNDDDQLIREHCKSKPWSYLRFVPHVVFQVVVNGMCLEKQVQTYKNVDIVIERIFEIMPPTLAILEYLYQVRLRHMKERSVQKNLDYFYDLVIPNLKNVLDLHSFFAKHADQMVTANHDHRVHFDSILVVWCI